MPRLSLRERRRELRRTWLQRWIVPAISRPMTAGEGATLVFAPHQDDETLGCGGLIARKRRLGAPVVVVFLTDGGRSLGDLPDEQRIALVEIRRKEALAALAILEVAPDAVHFLDFPDAGLSTLPVEPRRKLHERLVGLIERYLPEEVFVPHRRDSHPDHEAAFTAVLEAVRAVRSRHIAVYGYPVWLFWSRNRLFHNLGWSDLRQAHRLPIEAVLDQKRRAMAEYRSQLEHLPPRLVERSLSDHEIFFRVEASG